MLINRVGGAIRRCAPQGIRTRSTGSPLLQARGSNLAALRAARLQVL